MRRGWSKVRFSRLRNRQKELAARHENNLKKERAYNQAKKARQPTGNPWERVIANVEMRDTGNSAAKDLSRMRAVMAGRKNDVQEGTAAFN